MTARFRSATIAKRLRGVALSAATLTVIAVGPISAQTTAPKPPTVPVVVPDTYTIGAGDVLAIRFWRQNDVSGDVVVRPDGRISLLLLDDIEAVGLTPEQLRDRVKTAAERFFEDPQVTVIVKEINSRMVYITGMVAKPGPYPLRGPLRVLQLVAMAGGLLEYADSKSIVIIRKTDTGQRGFEFNYEAMRDLQRLAQNIELQPGDTVVVP
jgi:polysaccharide biosynthesis/export protein